MRNTLQQIDDALARIERGFIVLFFVLLVCVVVFNILSRNIFHLPSLRIFEAGPQLVLWLALLGASLALKQQRHIRLELLLRYCSNRSRRWAASAVNLFGAVVMGTLLLTSFEFVKNEIVMFGHWGILSIIFPIFFSMAMFRYLTGLLVRMPVRSTRDTPPPRPSIQ